MRSFPAGGAAVKLHFIVPRQAAEKSPKGAPPLVPGERRRPPDLSRGPSPRGPSSPFPQRQVCYDKNVTPHVHVRSTIKHNLTSSSWQINSHFLFLFQIKYRMCLGSQIVFTRMQF